MSNKLLYPLLGIMLLCNSLNAQDLELSPESQRLLQQAKKSSTRSVTANKKNQKNGFNLAITSRFEGGVFANEVGWGNGLNLDLFNVTSLELYIPSMWGSPKVRFLTTFRFSTPVLGEDTQDLLYVPRLGLALGFSAKLMDNRSSTGQGSTLSLNFLYGVDFNFLDTESTNLYISQNSFMLNRLDIGLRWTNFIHRNFGIVFGLDLGGGFGFEYHERRVGTDGYPIEPFNSYGVTYAGFFTFGATIGVMF